MIIVTIETNETTLKNQAESIFLSWVENCASTVMENNAIKKEMGNTLKDLKKEIKHVRENGLPKSYLKIASILSLNYALVALSNNTLSKLNEDNLLCGLKHIQTALLFDVALSDRYPEHQVKAVFKKSKIIEDGEKCLSYKFDIDLDQITCL